MSDDVSDGQERLVARAHIAKTKTDGLKKGRKKYSRSSFVCTALDVKSGFSFTSDSFKRFMEKI